MNLPDKKNIHVFNRTLFAWHKKNYREMVWRDTRDPYRILVSEVMLQQTQVVRVREKYAEFLKKFPRVEKLATAPLGEVLKVWSGLGYNRRAKFLHNCAKEVVAKHGGKFPDTFDELVKLPGIGISTAGALLAFSFREDVPMIDTNIRRILVRVFFRPQCQGVALTLRASDKELYAFASSIIPKGKGRAWNYAMLDLGASLCTARNHANHDSHDPECPLNKLHGKVDDFVYKKPQKKFAGSDRFYRGKLLRALTESKVSVQSVPRLLELPKAKATKIVEKLITEKLVVRKGVLLVLPTD